jgi:hypothetical protein
MKLTKGKIAKLYNKRKQTLKKKGKPKRSAGKSKTFRQNRKVNLSRQSLRRFSYLGGQLPVNRVLPITDAGLSAAQQGLSNVDQIVSEVPPVGPVGEARLGLTAAEMGMSGIQKGVEAAESVVNPTDELPESTVVSELPEPTVVSELPEQVASTDEELAEQVAPIVVNTETAEPVVTPEVTEQVVTPEVTEQVVTPELSEPVITPEVTEPVVTPEVTEQVVTPEVTEQVVTPEVTEQVVTPELSEPVITPEVTEPVVTPEVAIEEIAPADEQNSKLNDAVKTIVTEITKQVEENLTARAAQQDGEDDGFKAFTGAVDKMTSDAVAPESGGKRRRNTRRFKLVKNKTKRAAA